MHLSVHVEQTAVLYDTVDIEVPSMLLAYDAVVTAIKNTPERDWIVKDAGRGEPVPQLLLLPAEYRRIAKNVYGNIEVWPSGSPVPPLCRAWLAAPEIPGLHWVRKDGELLGCFFVEEIDKPKRWAIVLIADDLRIPFSFASFLWRVVTPAEQAGIMKGFPYE